MAWLGDVPFTTGLALVMFVAGVGTTMMAVFVERGLGWTAVGFLLTAVLVLAFPAARGIVMALGCGGSFAIGAWVWRRLDHAGARALRLVHQSGKNRTMASSRDR